MMLLIAMFALGFIAGVGACMLVLTWLAIKHNLEG